MPCKGYGKRLSLFGSRLVADIQMRHDQDAEKHQDAHDEKYGKRVFHHRFLFKSLLMIETNKSFIELLIIGLPIAIILLSLSKRNV